MHSNLTGQVQVSSQVLISVKSDRPKFQACSCLCMIVSTCQNVYFSLCHDETAAFTEESFPPINVAWRCLGLTADLLNRSESWGRPHWSRAWQHVGVGSFLQNIFYAAFKPFSRLVARITIAGAQMCAESWRSLTHTEHDEVSLAESLSPSPASQFHPFYAVILSLLTSFNFYFALCLSASMFFILTHHLSVCLSLLFHFCPGLKMSLRNLEIDEVLNERQPSSRRYNGVRNGINQRIWSGMTALFALESP